MDKNPKAQDETPSPSSPFQSVFFDLKKMEDEEKRSSPPLASNEPGMPASAECKDQLEKDSSVDSNKEKPTKFSSVDLEKSSRESLAVPPAVSESDHTELMDAESDTSKTADTMASTSETKDRKPSSPKKLTSDSSTSPSTSSASGTDKKQKNEIKDVDLQEDDKANVKKRSKHEEKMEVGSVKVELQKDKSEGGEKPTRPSSTPPSNAAQEKSSTSGLKRTLSEGHENDELIVKKEGKRPKVEHEELEAQLELKITAKAGSHHKLEKIVQQLVDERLKMLELTVFEKHFQELKDRVDKINCATKHQTAINSLQTKISRLAKKFGEANQASENKRKQEALAAAAAAAAAATKTAAVTSSPQAQRPIRTSIEVKQTPTVSSSSTAVVSVPASLPASATVSAPVPTSTSTAVVQQGSILQLIPTTSNAASTLATGITTQSQPSTLVLKTAPGSSMMTTGQPLVIQLPLSVNGQTGTLVNFPVSSLSAASSLNKAKTTPSTTTFILKSPPTTNTASASTAAAATLPTLQASTGQVPSTQISLARAVYQGGAGGITTPNAGVSVTTARTPVQSVSVVGAMSSASAPATSGPAATGSTAPGPPQGTSLTSKTDNQSSGSNPSKTVGPVARPKGSVIDLTEDDDDVQVTGVKSATAATPSSAPRSNPVISIPNNAGARSSPKSNQNSSSNPQITVHHRPPLDPPPKSRTVTTTTPARSTGVTLPPLPVAPVPSRLPPEAERSSPPQQLQLKLVPGQTGIVLSWSVAETDRTCAPVDSYHLYAFHQDNSSSNAAQQHWKKIGEVNALPLPMACTLTQFQSGSTYHFAVRAKDIHGRFGAFCEPQCTNVINSNSS
ncbi:activating transcription factor 7-interacting protein 1 isoform X2 [Melanotaenia boesemani]|uniref:activating transcription factor 7-interacting protein 1 isoform X2 n=1 Tax=Melanotaenia boesemani TaxID=1250792 RepID=UPI001C03A4B7|nr:activating transcription factor 7-interacting protein 1 isoform X2 [Melanotaenia boesemani]